MDELKKTEAAGVRLLPEEKKALREISRQDLKRQSDTLRDLIRKEAGRRGIWPPKGSRG